MNQVVGYLILVAVLILIVSAGILWVVFHWKNKCKHEYESSIVESDGYKDTKLTCKKCGEVKYVPDLARQYKCQHKWELTHTEKVYNDFKRDDPDCIPMGFKRYHRCVRCGEEKIINTWEKKE